MKTKKRIHAHHVYTTNMFISVFGCNERKIINYDKSLKIAEIFNIRKSYEISLSVEALFIVNALTFTLAISLRTFFL